MVVSSISSSKSSSSRSSASDDMLCQNFGTSKPNGCEFFGTKPHERNAKQGEGKKENVRKQAKSGKQEIEHIYQSHFMKHFQQIFVGKSVDDA